MMAQTDRPRPAEGATGRDLEDEYLFLDHREDRLHILNAAARRIYLLCDGTRSIAEIVEALMREFEVDLATARGDVERILAALRERNLIVC